MIEFQIVKCPSPSGIGTFKYFQNQVYLGKSEGDLWIPDATLLPNHLILEVIENDLLVHPQKNVDYYHINGKRASIIRKVNISDDISFGGTVLKIISFNQTNQETKKDILNNKLSNLIEINSPKLSVIEALGKMIK